MPNFDLRQFEPWLKQAPVMLSVVFAVLALIGGLGVASSGGGSSEGNSDSSFSSGSSQPGDQNTAPAPLPANTAPNEYRLWNTSMGVDEKGESIPFTRWSTATNIGGHRTVEKNEVDYPNSFVGGVANELAFVQFVEDHNSLKLTAFFEDNTPYDIDRGYVGIIENGVLTQRQEVGFDEVKTMTFDTKGARTVRIGMVAYSGDTSVQPTGLVLGSPSFAYLTTQ